MSCGKFLLSETAVSLELDFSSHRPALLLQLRPRHNSRVSSLPQEATSEMCHQMRLNVKYSLSNQLANLQPCSLLKNQSDLGVPHLFFSCFLTHHSFLNYVMAYQLASHQRIKHGMGKAAIWLFCS